jgi:hypothetical protein
MLFCHITKFNQVLLLGLFRYSRYRGVAVYLDVNVAVCHGVSNTAACLFVRMQVNCSITERKSIKSVVVNE